MKRSPELVPLSHDHHQALGAALLLKRADDRDCAAKTFLEFWQEHGREHFRIEEEVLLPTWFSQDPHADRELVAKVLEDHLTIRASVRRMESTGLALTELHALGSLLEAHVRLEERELFPKIEAGLDAKAIGLLGEELAGRSVDAILRRQT